MYRTCPDCGCALDPGEKCDCGGHPQQAERRREPRIEIVVTSDGCRAISYYGRQK